MAFDLSKTWYRARRFSRRIWVRTTSIAMLALIAAGSASTVDHLLPDRVAVLLGGEAVATTLEILASSMLAVTIFSLSIMIQARQSASTQVTPRSYRLLIEDPTTQTTLATFLGAFIFALMSLIAVSTDYYDDRSSAVIMVFTLTVIALVVIALLRWIEHLSDLGSVLHTTERVEGAVKAALRKWRRWPSLGARPLEDMADIPRNAKPVVTDRTGFVRHVDLAALSQTAEKAQARIWVVAPPGSFVARGTPLLRVEGEVAANTSDAFTLGDTRDFDQDPEFGVVVLAEIAQRALSPGLNDPGTAIDIVGRLVRLLEPSEDIEPEDLRYERVFMPPLDIRALFREGFGRIGRDGAGLAEVCVTLQQCLAVLAGSGDAELAAAARETSRIALDRSNAELAHEADRQRVAAVAPEA